MEPYTALIIAGSFTLGLVVGISIVRGLVWYAEHMFRKGDRLRNEAKRLNETSVSSCTNAGKYYEEALKLNRETKEALK